MKRVAGSSCRVAWFAAAILCAPLVFAHHSFAEYDFSRSIELTGTLVEFAWRNPHIQFKLQALPDAQGRVVTWDIEGDSLSVMRRTSVTAEHLKRGDKITIAGAPSRQSPNRLFVTNLLRADGVELLLGVGTKPRWPDAPSTFSTSWLDPGTPSPGSAGLFRVWSSKLDDPVFLWKRTYPLTEEARKTHARWDPTRDTVTRGCEPKGMPTIMEQPYPIEFLRKGNLILLRLEEYDAVRTIHMVPTADFKGLPRTRLGVSAGRWDGRTLVVTTDRIDWLYLDPSGVPLGSAATLVERFTPSDDGSSLNYGITITSPGVFTEPVELKRNWVWRPKERVQPFKCLG